MPLTAALAVSSGISLVGSLFGRSKRKRAANQRRAANVEQRRQTAISNELARRVAVTQQRQLAARAEASALARGARGSNTAANLGSLNSQVSSNIARQRQQEAADVRISDLSQSAQRNDARAQFTEGLASTFSSFASAALGPKPVVGA